MDQQKDSELVAAVQNGDILAYETLVRLYQRPVMAFAFRITGDPYVAAEIAQDTFFSVYQTIDRIDLAKKFSTYIFAIAKNASISYLRKKKEHISLNDREIAIDETVYETIALQEKEDVVRRALYKLPVKYRKIILLYYFEDLPYGEIAKKLHMPINTVRTHLLRAKNSIKKYLSYEQVT